MDKGGAKAERGYPCPTRGMYNQDEDTFTDFEGSPLTAFICARLWMLQLQQISQRQSLGQVSDGRVWFS